RRERRDKPGASQQAATNLANPRRDSEEQARTKSDALEEAGGALEPVAAKPAKQFLHPVGGPGETDYQPRDQQCSVHRLVLLVLVLSGRLTYSSRVETLSTVRTYVK